MEYAQFLNNHLLPNVPVLLDTCQQVFAWPLFAAWFNCSDGSVNYNRLIAEHAPHLDAVVLNRWARGEGKDDYLRDIHLPLLAEPELLYTPLSIVRDDWMNQYYLNRASCTRDLGERVEVQSLDASVPKRDDFRFVYMGGIDTFTALHCDVYSSYSISSQLHGSKKWTLFPPALTPRLLPLVAAAQYKDELVDIRGWTDEFTLEMKDGGMKEIYQHPGESIFIPSGWFHQVGSQDLVSHIILILLLTLRSRPRFKI